MTYNTSGVSPSTSSFLQASALALLTQCGPPPSGYDAGPSGCYPLGPTYCNTPDRYVPPPQDADTTPDSRMVNPLAEIIAGRDSRDLVITLSGESAGCSRIRLSNQQVRSLGSTSSVIANGSWDSSPRTGDCNPGTPCGNESVRLSLGTSPLNYPGTSQLTSAYQVFLSQNANGTLNLRIRSFGWDPVNARREVTNTALALFYSGGTCRGVVTSTSPSDAPSTVFGNTGYGVYPVLVANNVPPPATNGGAGNVVAVTCSNGEASVSCTPTAGYVPTGSVPNTLTVRISAETPVSRPPPSPVDAGVTPPVDVMPPPSIDSAMPIVDASMPPDTFVPPPDVSPPCLTLLASAINTITTNTTICPGTYRGVNIVVGANRIGIDAAGVIIDGASMASRPEAVDMTDRSRVGIRGLSIRNYPIGVSLRRSNLNTIEGFNFGHSQLFMDNSHSNRIINNQMPDAGGSSYPKISMNESDDNTLRGNIIRNGVGPGLAIGVLSVGTGSERNLIEDNTFENNDYAVTIWGGAENRFLRNRVRMNEAFRGDMSAVSIRSPRTQVIGNIITDNDAFGLLVMSSGCLIQGNDLRRNRGNNLNCSRNTCSGNLE